MILSERGLFLLFVKLERARRNADICMIQSCIEKIADYTKSIGKPYLLIFAFMYIRFSDYTPRVTHSGERLDSGDVRYMKDYKRPVSQSEMAIGEWATSMYDKYERHFFRAVYGKTDC
jgi:hypothetical protein